MPQARAEQVCPDLSQYQRLATGDLSDAEKDVLLQHLERCDSCAQKVNQLSEQDTLVELLRRADTLDDQSATGTIARLVERISQLRPTPERAPSSATVDIGAADSKATGEYPPSMVKDAAYDFLAAPQAADEIGRLGPYRVLQVLGAGGMGVVFRAEDPHLARLVALKAMLPGFVTNETSRERFLREARAAAAVKHDHIVSIYQVGEDRGVPYLAMEFLEGESLEARLQREGKLPAAEALRIGRQIALGLAAAHRRGLIHRDIKPANVWLEAAGEPETAVHREPGRSAARVKILDFGLARAAGDQSQLTQQGAIVGTPAYMAPEQGKGQNVDHRCDLFSLGCILYRMATGEPAFRGTDVISTLMAVATETPRSPQNLAPELPAALSALIVNLLAKDPEQRPASAQEVAAALERIANEETSTAAATRVPGKQEGAPAARPVSAGRRRVLAAVGVALALLVPLGYWLSGVIFRVRTPEGTLIVEVNSDLPNPDVYVDGEKVTVTWGKDGKKAEIRVKPGTREVEMKKEGFTVIGGKLEVMDGGGRVLTARFEPLAARPPGDGKLSPRYTNSLGMEFAPVPKGKGWIGGEKGKPGEKQVEFKDDFYLGVYEVTQEEWTQIMGENPSDWQTGPRARKLAQEALAGHTKEDIKRFPVEQVSWNDCQEFVGKLNEKLKEEGWIYRLPTEAEWEYACRGGPVPRKDQGFDYYVGGPSSTILGSQVNTTDSGPKRACKVGSYPPNPLGLHDMHGNVWEWCADIRLAADLPITVFGREGTPQRIARGGSWNGSSEYCRTVDRAVWPASERHHVMGLRLARVRVSADPDRRAAEWVLSVGGSPGIIVDGRGTAVKTIDDLPQKAFKIYSIQVVEPNALTDASLAHLDGTTELIYLRLRNQRLITDDGVKRLAANPGLARLLALELVNAQLTDRGMPHLKAFKQLKELDLLGAAVSDDGLRHLAESKELQNLTITGTTVNGEGLKHLRDLPTLTALAVSAKVNDAGLKSLCGMKLRSLRLDGGRGVTSAGMAHVAGLPELTSLHIPNTSVMDDGLAHLKSLKRLETLDVDLTNMTNAGLEHLRDLTSLKHLIVTRTKVTEAGVKKLAAALPGCKIEWDDGVIGPKGALAPAAPSAALVALRREHIPPAVLALAGDGDPKKAPPTLVAVLGEPEPIHTIGVVSLAYSPDGRWLASASQGAVLLHDAATGKVVRVLGGHRSLRTWVGFSTDSKTLLTSDIEGTVKLWPTAEEGDPTDVHLKMKILQMAVSPDGRFVAAGGTDGKVHLWKWGQWDKPATLPAVSSSALAGIAFSRDGELLAATWDEKKAESPVGIFKTADATLKQTLTGPKPHGSLSFSADGKYLACAGERDARLWDLASSKATDIGKKAVRLCFSPVDNRLAMFVHSDNHFHVYDADSGSFVEGTETIGFSGMIWSIAFSPDGKTMALGDHAGAVNVYDTANWRLNPKHIERGHHNGNLTLAVSPDGRTLLSSGLDNTLRLWNLEAPTTHRLFHHINSPYLSYSPKGKTFATGGPVWPVTFWDAEALKQMPPLAVKLTNLVHTPDGKMIAGQGTFFDKVVHLWDVSLGKEVYRFNFVGGGTALALSADGALLAAGSQEGKVAVWDVATGKEMAAWTAVRTSSLAFHPDGGSLAIGHHDGTITFWDAAKWQKVRSLDAHAGRVSTLKFTPDGRTLLSSSTDGVVQLRDPEHERAWTIIPIGPTGLPVKFDLDASGQYLFATGPTSAIYVHRLAAASPKP